MSWLDILKLINETPKAPPAAPTLETSSRESIEGVCAVYAALVEKRSSQDTMLWQAPMISLTAQAFLLQIALGSDSIARGDKIISGIAAMMIGLASWQVFHRHSGLERQASDELEKIELKYFCEKAHYKPSKMKGDPVANTPSKPIWGACLLIISFVGLIPLLEPVLKVLFPGYW